MALGSLIVHLLLSGFIGASGCQFVKRDPAVFKRVAGTWDWADAPGSCKDNPHTISFATDGRTMTLAYRHPIDGPGARGSVWRYEVRGHSDKLIRAALADPPETRRTATGELVVWDLFLVEDDAYVWVRTDSPDKSTKKVIRCAPAQ